MLKITAEELKQCLKQRKEKEMLEFHSYEFHNMDLTGWDLSNVDVFKSSFQNTILNGVNFENSRLEGALFDGCPMRGANLKHANMAMGAFRRCDLQDANIEGANLYAAVLELANLDGIKSNEDTKWFRMYCPEEGAFLAYKKCVGDRLVQLLVPADAKRTSATRSSCRVSKAKVLTIKSFDYKERYEEAWSLADEHFVYRLGQWVEVKDFNEDRWFDSTTGIHVWLTRQEAFDY